jgi:hypothetical protein
MHNSLGMRSSGIKYLKQVLVITVATGLVAVVLGCASMMPKPDFYPQIGDSHTMLYKDSKGKEAAVFDLTGKWEVYYLGVREVININQKGNSFEGFITIGNPSYLPGALRIFGQIEGNLVECNTQLYRIGGSNNRGEVVYYTSKLTKNVDSFECSGTASNSVAHRAIYKKIE